MANEISAVLEFGVPEPGETATMMEDKLRFHTDSWDLSVDLKAALADIVVIDARSRDEYIAGHIPGAISFPHRDMNAETVARFDRNKVYVVYCDGIGCNASTKGAYKLARLGFRVAPSRRDQQSACSNLVANLDTEIEIRPFADDDAPQARELFIATNQLLSPPDLRDAFEAYIERALGEEIDRITDYYREHDGGFWVSIRSNRLVGTFGLERAAPDAMELRRECTSMRWRDKTESVAACSSTPKMNADGAI